MEWDGRQQFDFDPPCLEPFLRINRLGDCRPEGLDGTELKSAM